MERPGLMPASMINARIEIIRALSNGQSISAVARNTGHGRNLIREVKRQLENNENISVLKNKLGAPKKRSPELENEIITIVTNNRRLGLQKTANCICNNPELPNVSRRLVADVLHEHKFQYLPPQETMLLTDLQRQARINFCNHHISQNTDWKSVLFTDESSFVCGPNRSWLWRRRGEIDDSIFVHCTKFPKKVMVFG